MSIEQALDDVQSAYDEETAIKEAYFNILTNLINTLAGVGPLSWDQAWEQAILVTGCYCEPYKSLKDPRK